MSVATRWILPVLVALTAYGCSAGGARGSSPSNDLGRALLAAARGANAAQSQLDILEKHSISYQDYESALNRYFDCLRDAGYPVQVLGTQKNNGVTLLDYRVGLAAGAQIPQSTNDDSPNTRCYTKYAKYVDMYWQSASPDAVAFQQRRAKALKPALEACLHAHGVDIPKDASFDDMIIESNQLEMKTKFSCMLEIGYGDWDG